ncbi:DUF6443 domain-containing protein [Chryseobacterium sp. 18068]|uniref:DUF6443 domain-containing protein n=1 Tax=Chryseobacterium sp. 18068 TaxID=2681414 RepID=UPI0013568160|nr:DUF6443 domain-containing protein [Chryseobacterium sp. 18068]
MKRSLNIFILLFTIIMSYAQTSQFSTTVNYVYSKNCLNDDCSRKSEVIQYFDELGRSKQIINIKGTPLGKDIVIPVEYDEFGRNLKSYLPIPQNQTQNGTIYENPHTNAPQTYGSDLYYYGLTSVESSPIGKILSSEKPGADYLGHAVTYGYGANIASDVKMYTVQTTWENGATKDMLSESSHYAVGQLVKNSVTDEDGNTSVEFINGKGQTVMVRKTATPNADTYYVYNKYNQLVAVIPPLASVETLSGTVLDNLCYQYKYDSKGRQIEKKLPGKDWEYFVYDKQDRQILAQSATLAAVANNFAQKGWMFTKYDKFGRIVYTGFFANTASRLAMQTAVNNMTANPVNNEERNTTPFTLNGMEVYYTKNAFPTGSMTILSVNYYDNYPSLPSGESIPSQILGQNVLTQDGSLNTNILPTATYTKNIENDSWTKNYIWYDWKGRVVGVYSFNHLGGYTKTETEIDFTGVTQSSVTKHKRLAIDVEKMITQTFEYDSHNRLLAHKHQVGSNPVEILAQNSYNELSQLIGKKVGGTSLGSPLENISYDYNIRGWLTKINDPKNLNGKLFGYEIKYNKIEGLETPNLDFTDLKVKPKYNGNIAEVDWKTSTTMGDNLRRYGYVYDELNRLSAGFYQKDTNPSAKEYFEKMDYDLNGNITHLQRSADAQQGAPAFRIDDLAYAYSGNRLTSVTDSSFGDYRGYPDGSGNTITYYEESGNMRSHKDKGILDIKYNYLDLPYYVTFDKTYSPRFGVEGLDYNVNTQYLYRADGVKLRKVYTYGSGKTNSETSKITEYLDGFQYEMEYTGGKIPQSMPLKFFPTAEGYYNFENNKYIYSYNDHLGNVRLSYTKGVSGAEIIEENNYYPFGLRHEGYNGQAGNPSYNYQFGGKELQKETGWGDFGARMYMSDIGKWGVVDPLSELTPNLSPYNYALNNPVMFIDPDGRRAMAPNDGGEMIGTGISKGGFANYFATGGYGGIDNLNAYLGNTGSAWGTGGSGFSTFGQTPAYGALMSSVLNGGGFSLSNQNNTLWWWTTPSGMDYAGSANMMKLNTQNKQNDFNWYGKGGKINWFVASAGASFGEFGKRLYVGTARPGSPVNFLGTKLYGNGKTFIKPSHAAKLVGRFSLGVAVFLDYNAYKQGEISTAKFISNTLIGGYGLTAVGTIPATVYFGVDAFYPGGWTGNGTDPGAIIDTSKMIEANQKIIPGFNIYRDMPAGF